MPEFVMNALFVFTGLLLIYELLSLLPGTAAPPLRALLHAVSGLCALLTANVLGGLFGLGVGLNALTLPVSAALGVPGVGLLWALRYLL